MSQPYFVYVLLSLKDQMFYTGYTKQLEYRLEQHAAGEVNSTCKRRPLLHVYSEMCFSQKDALARERYLKSGMGKRYIRNRLKTFLSEQL